MLAGIDRDLSDQLMAAQIAVALGDTDRACHFVNSARINFLSHLDFLLTLAKDFEAGVVDFSAASPDVVCCSTWISSWSRLTLL